MRNEGTKPVLKFNEYPYLQFPSNWEVAVISPYPYAEVRFLVRKRGFTAPGVSVYLDTQDALGSMRLKKEPYWKIYPNEVGDNQRFFMGKEADMMQAIALALAAGETI